MIKIFLTLTLLICLTIANKKATCVIEDQPYNSVKGTVDFDYDGTKTKITITITNTTGLVMAGNGVHIHQYGVTTNTKSCGDVAKHYNPILNYGELSGMYGTLPQQGSITYDSNVIKLDGDLNVLGRAVVIHNNTATRFGCCIIRLVSEDTHANDVGYNASNLVCYMKGYTFNIVNVGAATEVKVNVTDISVSAFTNNTIKVFSTSGSSCSSVGTSLYEGFTGFPSVLATDVKLTASAMLPIGDFAGRTLVRMDNTGTVGDCCVISQMGAQPNVNDAYTAPTPTPTPAPSGSERIVGLFVVFVLFVLLI